MRNLGRRLRRLESARRADASGLVPHSDAWFTFWADKFERSINGENVDVDGFPLAVIDWLVAADDDAEARAA